MLNLHDRVRLREHPRAPLLTVALVYLQGPDEAPWAGCRWTPPGSKSPAPQLVHFPQSELTTEGV